MFRCRVMFCCADFASCVLPIHELFPFLCNVAKHLALEHSLFEALCVELRRDSTWNVAVMEDSVIVVLQCKTQQLPWPHNYSIHQCSASYRFSIEIYTRHIKMMHLELSPGREKCSGCLTIRNHETTRLVQAFAASQLV